MALDENVNADSIGVTISAVKALKAHVKNGEIVLDDPVELTEGAQYLVFVMNDEMSDETRAQLNAMLDESSE